MTRTTSQRYQTSALAAALLVFVAACSEPTLDSQKYEEITPGMSLEEVIELLGKPQQQQQLALGPLGGLGGLESAEASWQFGSQEVIIRFVNNHSTIKELRAR